MICKLYHLVIKITKVGNKYDMISFGMSDNSVQPLVFRINSVTQ